IDGKAGQIVNDISSYLEGNCHAGRASTLAINDLVIAQSDRVSLLEGSTIGAVHSELHLITELNHIIVSNRADRSTVQNGRRGEVELIVAHKVDGASLLR